MAHSACVTRSVCWAALASVLCVLACESTLSPSNERPGPAHSSQDPGALPTTPGTAPAASQPPSPGPVVVPAAGACATQAPDPGPAPLRRLTHREYDNTVSDLLNTTTRAAQAFVAEERSLGFDNSAVARTVSQLLADQYAAAARRLSREFGENLGVLRGCEAQAFDEATCIASLIDGLAARAYRRPLFAGERDRLLAFYQGSRLEFGERAAAEMVVQAILQGAQFLYRFEFDATSGPDVPNAVDVVEVGEYELASRLSYFFWQSMPDAELFEAARAGQLRSPARVLSEARRLLGSPRARPTVQDFHSQWFDLAAVDNVSKDSGVYPAFQQGMGSRLRQQAEAFVGAVIFDGQGTLASLLTSPVGFIDDTLAPLYGLPLPGSTELAPTTFPEQERSGLLTQPAWLAIHAKPNQSSPVSRGYFVREALFCTTPPPPPPNLNVEVPAFDPNVTTRERFETHRSDPTCAGCHALLDPVGMGFENYDGIGAYRSQEANRPVDAQGELTATDIDGTFVGAVELAHRLASSNQVSDCAVKHWFHFVFGRQESQADGCTLRTMLDSFSASNGNIRELLLSMTQSPAFLYRKSGAGGTP
jgi:hypothetical protein